MVGIMTAVIIAVSYIIPNISFNFPLDSWAKEGRMNVGSQAATVQSCRLKIRSQQALVLMTVSLDNSPRSWSLQPGKINDTAVLKYLEGKFEIYVLLLTLIYLLLSPSSFHWVTTMEGQRAARWQGRQRSCFSFFHIVISSTLNCLP